MFFFFNLQPEILTSKSPIVHFTNKSDVYSFGVLMWELLTCKRPFPNLSPAEIGAKHAAGVRLELSQYDVTVAPPGYCKLMFRCWDLNPEKRPEFSEILEVLEDLIATHGITVPLDGDDSDDWWGTDTLASEEKSRGVWKSFTSSFPFHSSTSLTSPLLKSNADTDSLS